MTWADPISFRAALDDGAPHVVEMMAARAVDIDPDAVRLLISLARLAHQRCLSAWLRVHEPEYMVPPSTGPYARWENRGKGSTGRFRDGSDLPRAPLAAIAVNVALWGYVLAIYPDLNNEITIEFPPIGDITTLRPRSEILTIPTAASAILVVNLLAGLIFEWKERAATYLVLSATLFFQVLFFIGAAIAVVNA